MSLNAMRREPVRVPAGRSGLFRQGPVLWAAAALALGLSACAAAPGLPDPLADPGIRSAWLRGEDLHAGCRPGVPTHLRGVLYTSATPDRARVYEVHDDPHAAGTGVEAHATARDLPVRSRSAGQGGPRILDPWSGPVRAVPLGPRDLAVLTGSLAGDRARAAAGPGGRATGPQSGSLSASLSGPLSGPVLGWTVSGCLNGRPVFQVWPESPERAQAPALPGRLAGLFAPTAAP
ncbi:hypothetical protein IHV25_02080 [Phaeovibrio sulfidiphilus]|uniref:Uncharacterized protein n=1 Tax=Phaeovibrio sulfidiphilus TaxID=1220600 RepID=A0A8J6YXF4_9PROT|nr:hypothetical protein [Phaeovibrio sulfidiphilus]MBE1236443.1 hypothetical protein [Phaeovibrio sulfidiphilus]